MLIRVTRKSEPPRFRLRVLSHGKFVEPVALAEPETDEFEHVKRFDVGVSIEAPDAKNFSTVKDSAGNVIDYRGVTISGYLSTFKNVTESDRQGDYVEPGAFKDSLVRFRQNPVMLTDHRNAVPSLAGRFTSIAEDKNGLKFEGALSDRPGNADARFLVAEGTLKTVSMGGLFHYKEDGRGIFKVDLWEGSLTPVPANQDARFSVRSLNDTERRFIKSGMDNFHDFLLAQQGVKTVRE